MTLDELLARVQFYVATPARPKAEAVASIFVPRPPSKNAPRTQYTSLGPVQAFLPAPQSFRALTVPHSGPRAFPAPYVADQTPVPFFPELARPAATRTYTAVELDMEVSVSDIIHATAALDLGRRDDAAALPPAQKSKRKAKDPVTGRKLAGRRPLQPANDLMSAPTHSTPISWPSTSVDRRTSAPSILEPHSQQVIVAPTDPPYAVVRRESSPILVPVERYALREHSRANLLDTGQRNPTTYATSDVRSEIGGHRSDQKRESRPWLL